MNSTALGTENKKKQTINFIRLWSKSARGYQ